MTVDTIGFVVWAILSILLSRLSYLTTTIQRLASHFNQPKLKKIHGAQKGHLANCIISLSLHSAPPNELRFIELSGGKKLERDNSTRWNSWSHMIACALRPEIRRAIKIFCQEFELDKDALDLNDWT